MAHEHRNNENFLYCIFAQSCVMNSELHDTTAKLKQYKADENLINLLLT